MSFSLFMLFFCMIALFWLSWERYRQDKMFAKHLMNRSQTRMGWHITTWVNDHICLDGIMFDAMEVDLSQDGLLFCTECQAVVCKWSGNDAPSVVYAEVRDFFIRERLCRQCAQEKKVTLTVTSTE